jgi:fatty-acyl-CoA synthase
VRDVESDIVVWGPGPERVAVGWSACAAAAERVAEVLRRHDLTEGDVLVVAGATGYATLLVLLAAWSCGAAVSIVPAGAGRRPAAVAAGLVARAASVAAPAAYAGPATWAAVAEAAQAGHAPVRVDEAAVAAAVHADHGDGPGGPGDAGDRLVERLHTGLPADGLAVLQATSGSTGEPRLVPVTWGMVRANMAAIARRLELDGRDSFVSWMPLYHDMGLFGYVVLPALLRARMTLVPPEAFAVSPGAFVKALALRRGTMSGVPTSGLALLERALGRGEAADLSPLRRLVCGAEMIDVEVSERLLATGRRHGLAPDVLAYAYGMAEATLAVSLRPGTVPAEAEDAGPVASSHGDAAAWCRPGARGLPRTGTPVDAAAVRVAGPTGAPCPERVVGEIEIRGPSVMAGYLGRTPAESGVVDGWLRTGDLGYLAGGEIVVVGRRQDVVVVGGRKLLPDDVERVVGALPGIRAGRVVAVPIAGRAGEALAVVAERRDDSVDERAVRVAVRAELGVTPERVVFVARGAVPKTSSGKLRRAASRGLVTGTSG